MTIIGAIFLGIIQGLTEFLPVSSSGHLVLFSHLLDVQEPSLVFEIVVHVGTLLAVLVVFKKELLLLIASFFKILRNPKDAKSLVHGDSGCRLLWGIVLATLPVVILAVLFKDQIEQLFASSLFVGFMLIITGTILYVTERQKMRRKDLAKLSAVDALVIGTGQAVAILPGISRSGTTIAMGLARGLDRESAARFSFLLTIPAILGALVFSIDDLVGGTMAVGAGALVAGLVAAALTGYLAIHFLLNLIKKGKLVWFSYYTWFLGSLVIVLHLL